MRQVLFLSYLEHFILITEDVVMDIELFFCQTCENKRLQKTSHRTVVI